MDGSVVELDHRRSADIEVSLLWYRHADKLVVVARDHRTGEALEINVAHDQALRAFRHPYAYAAAAGSEADTSSTIHP